MELINKKKYLITENSVTITAREFNNMVERACAEAKATLGFKAAFWRRKAVVHFMSYVLAKVYVEMFGEEIK